MPGFKPVDPKQSFPELERRVLERWRERDVFARSLANREDAEVWSFYEGPPTANGRPGSHHVLSRVFKDVYPRYRTMRGYRVPRKAGWDCHGLPVELEVEKELGIGSKQEVEEYGIDKFNARCRESVFEYVEEWNRLTERIGFWIDLDDPYVTLEDNYIESVWWSLRKLWDDERLYEGHKVVPYCPRCGTALSSHEVALGYKDVSDPSIYVRFPLLGEDGTAPDGESLLVWTTTPWTLPGNVAVAVAPEVAYVRARVGGETLILAEPLVEKVLGEGVEIVGERFPGSELVGRAYDGPVFALADGGPSPIRRDVAPAFRVLAGEFVTTEDGTGLVHIAPAFGEDDYAAAAAAGIFDPTRHATLYNPVGLDGRFDDRVTGFAGEFVKDPEVTRRLIDDLDRRSLLFREQVYEHAYPHCWRCGTALLYYAKSSWYVATSKSPATPLLANNEAIGWHPEHIKHGRFGKWLENNVDWALSRDRYWGTPLPIWECEGEGCDGRFCAGSVAELRERAGGEVPDDLHRPYIDEVTVGCADCGGEMRRVESVIDTWYDSGAMPFAQFHYPFENEELFEERFPADFICEAIDQTRGWFYTLLAESTLLFDELQLPQLRLPRPDPRPRGAEDVEEQRQRGRALGGDRHPRRRRLPLVLPDRAAALGRLPLLGRDGRRVGAPVPAHPLEHLLVLGALRQRRELVPSDFPIAAFTSTDSVQTAKAVGPRSLGAVPVAVDDRHRHHAHGRVRLHRRRPRDRRVRRAALQLVRAALAAPLLGGRPRRLRHPASLPARDRRAARPLHPLPRRRDPPQPRRRRGRATSVSCPTRSTCAISPRPTRRSPTPSSRPRWRRCGSRSSSAAPPAPRRRRRCANRCAAP